MDSTQFLSQFEWVALPMEVRVKLREEFKIKRSGQVRVTTFGGHDRVVSDGTEPQDLMEALNVRTMLEYLEEKYDERKIYDFSQLFPLVLTKIGFPPVQSNAIVDAKEATAGKTPDAIPPKPKTVKPVSKPGTPKIKLTQKSKAKTEAKKEDIQKENN